MFFVANLFIIAGISETDTNLQLQAHSRSSINPDVQRYFLASIGNDNLNTQGPSDSNAYEDVDCEPHATMRQVERIANPLYESSDTSRRTEPGVNTLYARGEFVQRTDGVDNLLYVSSDLGQPSYAPLELQTTAQSLYTQSLYSDMPESLCVVCYK